MTSEQLAARMVADEIEAFVHLSTEDAAQHTAAERMTAKGLVARVTEQRVLELALRCNVTPAAMRKQLKSDAHWQPALVVSLLTPKAA